MYVYINYLCKYARSTLAETSRSSSPSSAKSESSGDFLNCVLLGAAALRFSVEASAGIKFTTRLQGPVGRLRLLPALMYAVARGYAGPSALSKSHPKADFSGFQGAPGCSALSQNDLGASQFSFNKLQSESEIARFMRGDRIRTEVELNVTFKRN